MSTTIKRTEKEISRATPLTMSAGDKKESYTMLNQITERTRVRRNRRFKVAMQLGN